MPNRHCRWQRERQQWCQQGKHDDDGDDDFGGGGDDDGEKEASKDTEKMVKTGQIKEMILMAAKEFKLKEIMIKTVIVTDMMGGAILHTKTKTVQ